jgi:DNA-binding MarR family transcriptional regulator
VSDKATAVTAWEALFRAQVSVMRHLSSEFPTDEISLNEYDVLFNLSRQPGRQLRMKNLNRHLLLTQPSVSRLVDRLTTRGLLAKSHDQDDARGVNVTLTPAGFELFRRVARSHIKSIAERVGGTLSTTELETLIGLCDRLRLAGTQ